MIEIRAAIDLVTVEGFVKKRGQFVEFADDLPAVLSEDGCSLIYRATHRTHITGCTLKNGNALVYKFTVDMPVLDRGGTAHIRLNHPFTLQEIS